jgi:hypothetical protein
MGASANIFGIEEFHQLVRGFALRTEKEELEK